MGNAIGNPWITRFDGLLRSDNDDQKNGFRDHVGQKNNLRAELVSILQGLQISWNSEFWYNICYSFSLNEVNLIHDRFQPYHAFVGVFHEVSLMSNWDWIVQLHHTPWEGNRFADFFAKIGSSHHDPFKIVTLCFVELEPTPLFLFYMLREKNTILLFIRTYKIIHILS